MGIKVAIAGMNFGAQFIPCYLHHPFVDEVSICDISASVLETVSDKYKLKRTFENLDEILKADDIDAVHIVTPINLHASQSVKVLMSGRHCACAIPMGLSINELMNVAEAVKKSGKNYMMMETAVYTRAYLHVKEMHERNEFGRIQFMKCAHYQDMEGWPDYWRGFPPMMHPTHALAPCIDLTGAKPDTVRCLGSGYMRQELIDCYKNPFPVETALISLKDSCTVIEATRSMFHTARAISECFCIYGEKASFEWQQIEEENPVIFRSEDIKFNDRTYKKMTAERIAPPDRSDLLPLEISRFTRYGKYDEDDPDSFNVGGGHWGSHPHLANEFVRSIMERRKPYIDEIKAAYWTGTGICAHESAMKKGAEIIIPDFA